MPQVNIKNFDKLDPLEILAYQYDLVCNGYELSSGAIRNHIPEYLFKVFGKVGYSKQMVEKLFWNVKSSVLWSTTSRRYGARDR